MSIIQVDNEQKTIHFSHQTQIEKKPPPTRKKKKALSFHDTPFHWLHGNFIVKITYHHFWHGLIAFLRTTYLHLLQNNNLQKPEIYTQVPNHIQITYNNKLDNNKMQENK